MMSILARTLIFMLFFITEVFAATPDTPCSSNGIQFTADQVILNADQSKAAPALYLLHNRSNETIAVDHVNLHPSASAGWGSELKANHRSAILINAPHFGMMCMRVTETTTQRVACVTVLDVCQWNDPNPLPAGQQGWVSEDQATLEQLWTSIQQNLKRY